MWQHLDRHDAPHFDMLRLEYDGHSARPHSIENPIISQDQAVSGSSPNSIRLIFRQQPMLDETDEGRLRIAGQAQLLLNLARQRLPILVEDNRRLQQRIDKPVFAASRTQASAIR